MPSLTQILNIINESSPQDNPEEFTFPWYTTCIKWEDYSPLSKTTLIALGVLAGAGLLAAPFFGPIGLVGVVVGFICGYSAIHQAFGHRNLSGKRIFLIGWTTILAGISWFALISWWSAWMPPAIYGTPHLTPFRPVRPGPGRSAMRIHLLLRHPRPGIPSLITP